MGTKKDAIKAKAQAQRELRNKKEKRSKLFFQLGIIGAILAAATTIALVIVFAGQGAAGRTPANMASGGVRFENASLTPVTSPGSDTFGITTPKLSEDNVDIRIYVDYLCPFCGDFEAEYGTYLTDLVESGDITLEYHPVAILDRLSMGTKYSTRAAAASACVAANSPEEWVAYNEALFASQPAENSEGLSDDQLIQLASQVKASGLAEVTSCINDKSYVSWAKKVTAAASKEIPFIGQGIAGTPTIVVNGQLYVASADIDFKTYVDSLVSANEVVED